MRCMDDTKKYKNETQRDWKKKNSRNCSRIKYKGQASDHYAPRCGIVMNYYCKFESNVLLQSRKDTKKKFSLFVCHYTR